MSVHISSQAWKVNGLTMAQKIVLVKLADNANDQGQCYPSVSTISRECSCTDRAVFKSLAALESAGHISRRQRTGTSTMYSIHPCTTFTPERSSPLNIVHTPHERSSPPPLNHVHPTPERSSPKPSLTINRTINEPSMGKKRFQKPTIEEIQKFDSEIDASRFYDYYEAKGWLVGKTPMKDWQAAVRNWKRNNFNSTNKTQPNRHHNSYNENPQLTIL